MTGRPLPYFPPRPVKARAALSAAWAGVLFLAGAAGAQDRLSDDVRRPNVVKPTYFFGLGGGGKGELRCPSGVTFGKDNRIYVADAGNHRIQVFGLDGKPLAQWGRLGSGEGEFRFPGGVCVGPDNDVYIADTGNHRVQVLSPDGVFRRSWGRCGRLPGEFLEPVRVAACGGSVAVVDRGNCRVELYTIAGKSIRSIGSPGDGPGQFRDPADAASDSDGALYVVDANSRVQKFDASGAFAAQWGSWGGHEGLLAAPGGIACAGDRVYVADTLNHRVQVFDRSGTFQFQWGSHPTREGEGLGRMHLPSGIAVSPSGGWTVVCESADNRCQVFPNGTARNAVPVKDLPWWDDMHARLHAFAQMSCPASVAQRPAYWERNPPVLAAILERENQAILFFDIAVRPCAFLSRAGGPGGKLGEFRDPVAIAQERGTGRVFVCDRGNRRVQVLELPRDPFSANAFVPGARVIAAFEPAKAVPESVEGYRRDQISLDAVALDREGRVYVADSANAAVLVFDRAFSFVRRLRVPERVPGEGCRISGVGVSPDLKTVYVADRDGFRILGLDEAGVVRSSWGHHGDDGSDSFLSPAGLAVDDAGCVYASDSILGLVRKFDSAGKVLVADTPRGMKLCSPQGILMPRADRLIVDDFGNHRGVLYDGKGTLLDDFYKGGSTGPPSTTR
jgi:DNA-binding beta-propeller fold protein YncE